MEPEALEALENDMDKNTKVGGPWKEIEKPKKALPKLNKKTKAKIKKIAKDYKETAFTDEQLAPFLDEPFPKYDPFDNYDDSSKPAFIPKFEPVFGIGSDVPIGYIEKSDDTLHGWIQLYSGRKFFPLNPQLDAIDIEDIAHSLSNMCRFTGHVKSFYSVAQHSVLVSYLCGPNNALYGLLHDATEAYLVDMPKPIKRLETFSNFRDIEHNIMKVIAKKFGLPDVEPPAVKTADIKILATEARDLMSPLHPDWKQPCEPYPFRIDPLPPLEAKKLFMTRYMELTNGKNS